MEQGQNSGLQITAAEFLHLSREEIYAILWNKETGRARTESTVNIVEQIGF